VLDGAPETAADPALRCVAAPPVAATPVEEALVAETEPAETEPAAFVAAAVSEDTEPALAVVFASGFTAALAFSVSLGPFDKG
jgi:hypothetical protein